MDTYTCIKKSKKPGKCGNNCQKSFYTVSLTNSSIKLALIIDLVLICGDVGRILHPGSHLQNVIMNLRCSKSG